MWPNRPPQPAQRRTVHASLGRCKQPFIIYSPPPTHPSYRAMATGETGSRVCVKVCVKEGGDHSRGSRRKRRTRS